MAAYDLEEQDQLEDLKAWWKQWGNTISGVVIAVCVGVIAVQGWRWWSQQQAEKALGALQRGQRRGARERRREGEGCDGAAHRQVRRHRVCAARGADRRGDAQRHRRQGRRQGEPRRRDRPRHRGRAEADRTAAPRGDPLRRQAVRRCAPHARREARRRVRGHLRRHARGHPRRRGPHRGGTHRVHERARAPRPAESLPQLRAGEARHAGRRRAAARCRRARASQPPRPPRPRRGTRAPRATTTAPAK